MLSYIARRILATVPVLVIVAVLVFLRLRRGRGDPGGIVAGDAASSEQIAQIRANLGLEKSIVAQFGIWAGHLLRGDLGESFYFKIKVTELIAQRIEPTMSLAALTIFFAVLVSVPLGVMAAWRFGGCFVRFLMGVSVMRFSGPGFVLASVVIDIVSLSRGAMPAP